jgi:hypothetical protein
MNIFEKLARSLALLALLVLSSLIIACGGDDQGETQAARQATADAPPPAQDHPQPAQAGGEVTIAGITVTVPDSWQDLGPSGMRQAQFQLPPVEGDTEPAEVNVFYFGPASGGGVEANLQRWIGQMTVAEGTEPTRSTFTADGMSGHVVSVDGSYNAGGMRPMGGGDSTPKPGYRLVGVVLEGPEGSLFFKLTGPVATARAMEAELMPMMESARKAG